MSKRALLAGIRVDRGDSDYQRLDVKLAADRHDGEEP
jgi:hypothetical protein